MARLLYGGHLGGQLTCSAFRHWLHEKLQCSQHLLQKTVLPKASPAPETHTPDWTPLDKEVRTKSGANTSHAPHIILLYFALDNVQHGSLK